MDLTAFARRAAGIALLAVGIAMIPLPGPGWPVVFAALALLGVPLAPVVARLPVPVRAWLPSSTAA